jgi:hypothetical protein
MQTKIIPVGISNQLKKLITLRFILIRNTTYSVISEQANGLRYLRWGGDGEAVQPEK